MEPNAESTVITDTSELCRILALPPCSVPSEYPLLVPHHFVDLMERGNPNDPLLLQILPRAEELQNVQGFSPDPLGEIALAKDRPAGEGVALKKYAGRTLLLVSQECGIHCRFCFRRHFPRHFPKMDGNVTDGNVDVDSLLAPLRHDTAAEEVILSGGDPLTLNDETLDRLLQALLQLKHVRRIRIHSRLPIVLPSRLTPALAEILTLPIPLYLVLHINHPHELSEDFLERRELLTKPLLMAQTVLLRKVNDNIETLDRLFRRLIDARILPYYLHQLDRVAGAAHFEVPSESGRRILAELRGRLPGYAVPAYVREVNGRNCKEPITGIPISSIKTQRQTADR